MVGITRSFLFPSRPVANNSAKAVGDSSTFALCPGRVVQPGSGSSPVVAGHPAVTRRNGPVTGFAAACSSLIRAWSCLPALPPSRRGPRHHERLHTVCGRQYSYVSDVTSSRGFGDVSRRLPVGPERDSGDGTWDATISSGFIRCPSHQRADLPSGVDRPRSVRPVSQWSRGERGRSTPVCSAVGEPRCTHSSYEPARWSARRTGLRRGYVALALDRAAILDQPNA